MTRYHYLTGMPRSGSTLLGSLLNQHADVHVTPTSPVDRVMTEFYYTLQENAPRMYNFDWMQDRIFKYMISGWHSDIEENHIFIKSRGWGFNIPAIQEYINPNCKVLLTYRSIPDIITSFIALLEADPKNTVDLSLYKENKELNVRNRAASVWSSIEEYSWNSTKQAIDMFSDSIHIIHYDDLVNNYENSMAEIWGYLDINTPIHDFQNVDTYLKYPDENWGIDNLHHVRPKVEKTSKDSVEILGEELFEYYSQFNLLGE